MVLFLHTHTQAAENNFREIRFMIVSEVLEDHVINEMSCRCKMFDYDSWVFFLLNTII